MSNKLLSSHYYGIGLRSGVLGALRSYLQMMKPTISIMVMVTAVPAVFMASGQLPSVSLVSITLIGTFLASASAGMLNHFIDADIDARMLRTMKRPMASKSVSRVSVFLIAVLLGALSTMMLWSYVNPLSAVIAVCANFFYVVIYTILLKRRTPQNIVIGGAAGAVGPLIGWAAGAGSLSIEAYLMFAVVFLWTPPHFWALALKYREDYARVGIPMLPVVVGEAATKRQIFAYTLLLWPVVIWLGLSVDNAFFSLPGGVTLTALFIFKAFKLLREDGIRSAMPLFYYSLIYILGIFAFLTLDATLFQ